MLEKKTGEKGIQIRPWVGAERAVREKGVTNRKKNIGEKGIQIAI